MQSEVIHPNWPTIWPRMQTDGKILVPDNFIQNKFANFLFSCVYDLTLNIGIRQISLPPRKRLQLRLVRILVKTE